MATKENIGCPLTQPVKDIADWGFPLSEVLERYVQRQSPINFAEAALVVQKSTSAYVVRVEELHNKATVLQQPLEETKTENSQEHGAKRGTVDCYLENFRLVDMERRVGRNIDITIDENDMEEAVKLMSRRFPELENYDETHSRPAIQIVDVWREVIGKKYDFRCNHPVDIDGALVDESIPDEVESIPPADVSVKERRCSSLLAVEVHTPGTVSSGFGSSASMSESQGARSPQDLDTCNANLDHFESDYLSDDYLIPDTFEESMRISTSDASWEEDTKVKSAERRIEMTPRKRSERVRNMHHLISQVTRNGMKREYARCQASGLSNIQRTIKKTPRRTRKPKQPTTSRNELDACIHSMEDSLRNALSYEAVEDDDSSNLLGFRLSADSAVKEVEEKMSENSCEKYMHTSTPLYAEESQAESMSPDLPADWDRSDTSFTVPDDYQSQIEDKMNEIVQESNVRGEWKNAVAEWHRSLEPKLLEAEQRTAFDLRGYESEIVSNLKASESKKCDFRHVARKKPFYEVSRYFLASLHLASASSIVISQKEGLSMKLRLTEDQRK